jgi:hypothetical protein
MAGTTAHDCTMTAGCARTPSRAAYSRVQCSWVSSGLAARAWAVRRLRVPHPRPGKSASPIRSKPPRDTSPSTATTSRSGIYPPARSARRGCHRRRTRPDAGSSGRGNRLAGATQRGGGPPAVRRPSPPPASPRRERLHPHYPPVSRAKHPVDPHRLAGCVSRGLDGQRPERS